MTTWTSSLFKCRLCDTHPVIQGSEHPEHDYDWRCPTEACPNSMVATSTGDMEEPDWVLHIPKPLSETERALRAPLPVDILLGALEDKVHKDGPCKPIKTKKV